MNRRQFLFTASAPLLVSRRATVLQKPRVIVAGAGLAGLSAAYQMARAGYQVTVLEARTRPGGRVFTLRDQFADGLYVETGGEVVGNGYARFLAYCKEFGVAVDEVAGEAGGRGLGTLMRGKFFAPGAPLNPHPYGLTGEEAALTPPQLLAKHLREMGEEVSKDQAKLAEFDKISLAEALKARGASVEARRLMEIALNYNDINTVSASGVLWENRRRARGGTKAMRVRGGNSRLIEALTAAATRAGVQFLYNAALVRVAHVEKSVSVWFRNREHLASEDFNQVLEADHFISTLPATTLRLVDFQPRLPEANWQAIRDLPYTLVTKIWLQARRAAWDAAGYGSGAWTDTPLERVVAGAGDVKAARMILTVWLDGAGAVQNNLPDVPNDNQRQSRSDWATDLINRRLPKLAGSIEGGASIAWAQDRWAYGAYAHFARGQLLSLRPHLAAPVGRLHFAGEHTAETAPGMEGALESAERVVGEIKSSQ